MTLLLAGGKLEFTSPELEAWQTMDVVVSSTPSTRSAWQIISEELGQRLFKSAKEVDDYLVVERASSDRCGATNL